MLFGLDTVVALWFESMPASKRVHGVEWVTKTGVRILGLDISVRRRLSQRNSCSRASSGSRGVEVKTQRLDDLVFGTEPVITRRVDLIKADTQGSELMMMRGGEQLLRRDRPLLCLEFEPHLNGIDYSVELVRWLESMGYTSFRFFHANVSEPFTIVQELHLLENGDDIVARVRRKVVGPFGTLIAYPSEPMPDSQLPPVNAP